MALRHGILARREAIREGEMTTKYRRGLAVLAAMLACIGAAQAQYPNKPIRLIVPFPPGGSVDVTGRLLAPLVSKSLGQQVVVDNRSGASGIIGTEAAARSAPDGYSLLLNTTPLVTNTVMFSKVPYNVLADFEPISMLASAASFVGVHPSVPARSVKELIQIAKSKPGALNYGSAGIGTNPHIGGELFNYLAKTNIVAVHFKGGGPALVAGISGEVGVVFSAIAGSTGFVQSGRLRALGVTSLKPVAALPGVPTIADSGLPGYEFTAWFALMAPKGTSREIISLLNDHFRKAMSTPDAVRRLEQDALDVVGSSPEQLGAALASELKKWATVIRERGMKAE
jgi:tripartite-type tricarboxylate transporter receptor subunit TctC